MNQQVVTVSPDGRELTALLRGLGAADGGRVLLGITGSPGAGKSTLAAALVDLTARSTAYDAVVVPMDGFHLADVELVRRGLRDRKGAPETFDADGYADLLARIRTRPSHPVMAPMFERGLEQPVAGAIPVPASAGLVVTEGNYLLLERPPWPDVRARLDRVWHVVTDDALRLPRLVARHVASGKTPAAAAEWVQRVDQPNAVLVEEASGRADLLLDLTAWRG